MSPTAQLARVAKRSTVWWVGVIYGVAALVVVGIAVITYRATQELMATQRDVDHTHVVLGLIERAYSSVVGSASAVRDYVVADDELALAGRDEELSRLYSALQDLAETTADNPAQQRRLERLRPLIEARVDWINRTLLTHQSEGGDAARAALRDPEPRRLTADIRTVLDEMRLEEERLLSTRFAAQESSQARSVLVSVMLMLAVAIAVLAGLIALVRDGRYKDRLRTLIAERERRLAVANDDLRRNAEALSVANKELESFSYSISHDLRSPLRAIDGFASMLEEDCAKSLDAEGRRYISVIRDNAGRMSALIDDLLKFSRLGRQRLQAADTPTEQIVQRACAEALTAFPQSTAQFDIGPLPKSHGDASLLHQVWVNLIANAVKYSSRVANPHVTIGGEVTGDSARYFVRDNGAGFDMRYVDKLFGVFQRLHGPDEFPGTGVGLAIVQRIVSRHGGRAWAEGELGKGATFYFTLPLGSSRESSEEAA